MTGRDLVSASARLLGVLATGETLSAQEATDGLATLNRMLDSWSEEKLLVYARVREVFALTPGQSSRTLGTGGNFNTARPQAIAQARLLVNGLEYPVDILSEAEWAAIADKSVQTEIPTAIYPEGTYPLETVNIYPVPSAANSLVLYSWKPLSTVATLDTAISLPPGYERALVFNLAVDLAPEYGRPVPDRVDLVAARSLASIKRKNFRPSYLQIDGAIPARGRGRVDIRSGR